MKKLGIILILTACLTLLCVTGAMAISPSGNCGYEWNGNYYESGRSNATFTYDASTETLTITGTGGINCNYVEIIADEQDRKAISHVVIDDRITTIGEYCFSSFTNLTSINLPSSLTTIMNGAFDGCTSLEGKLVIPEGVTTIGDNAFARCKQLTSVKLPTTLTKIGGSAFDSCSGWEGDLVIPENVTEIGASAFGWCSGLESITIPDTVTKIGQSAFNGCTNAESITIPSGLKKISDYTFSGCSSWEGKATIPEGVTEIGANAFDRCNKLEEVVIPATVTKIGEGAFRDCSSFTGTLVIPDTVTNIQAGAFVGLDKVAALQFPTTLTVLKKATQYEYDRTPPVIAELDSDLGKLVAKNGYSIRQPGTKYNLLATYSGSEQTALTVTGADKDCGSIVLPEGVTAIAEYAFNECNNLKVMVLPKSLTSIGNNAFMGYDYYENDKQIWRGLTDVFYAGTQSEKEAITIGKENNDAINNAIWHIGEDAPADLTNLWTVSYDWDFSNNNQGKLKAKAVCKNNPEHTIEETVNAWYNIETDKNPKHTSPSCTEDGLGNAWSDSFKNKCFVKQTQADMVIPAYGHEYTVTKDNQPQYAWAIDYSKAFASLKCIHCWNDKSNLIEEAEATASVQGGKKTYTATFKDERFEDQSITVVAGRDITPPQLTKVTLNSKKISKPGILYVTLDFVEEESGLASCWINTCEKGKTNWTGNGGENWESDPPFTGTITLEVPIDTKFPAGEHYVTNIQLQDTKGNSVNYNVDTWYYSPTGDYDISKLVARDDGGTNAIIATVPIDNGFEVTEDSDADFEYLITAPKLMDEIKGIKKGGQGVILFNYNQHTAPKAMFEAMKEKDATFTFSNNEIQWQWAGSDITEECKDVDLQVNSWTAPGSEYGIEGDEDVLVIQFADNGKLPGPVKIRIKSDYYFKINGLKRAAYLYFSNNGQLYNQESGVNAVLDQGDHWCEFTITHNSTYIVSANKAKQAGDDPNDEKTPEDKVAGFVKRCYKLILNRDADEDGLKGWSDALTSKTATAAQIIDGFVRSQEFTNRNLGNDAAVDILYNTMLDRAADAGGKAGWVDALNKGYTLQNIIDGFCGSPEFKAICDSFGIEPGSVGAAAPADMSTPRGKIEAFVKRCYSLILSRDADQGGLQGWSDALESGAGQACQIIDGFVRSEEYTNRNLDAGASVDILYKTMLNRDPDPDGRAGWVDALGQGYTLQHIINGFCGSAEFTAICNDYGITAGTLSVASALVKREAITPEGDEAEAPVVYQGYNSEFINEEKIRAFVEHCYVAVFGREGDTEGVENYTKLILNGKKLPKKVAYEFIFSPEFQEKLPGNEEFIRILYRLYFDREPGAEELAGWVKMLEEGASLEEIVNGFAGSAEFKAIVNEMKE